MTHPQHRLRRAGGRSALAAAATALVVGSVGFGPSIAKAANPNDFELLATATAIDSQIRDNSFPVTQVIEFSSFGASATLSSSGVVKADAGAPYAPFGYSLPSTVTGVGAGLLPPIPPFPGYVAASFPVKPSDTQKTGGYALSATTSDSAARGQVDLGSQPAGSSTSNGFAVAETLANDDGSVTVQGSAGMSAFSFGGVFDLGRVASTLSMRVPDSGKPAVTGTTELGTVTFASTFTSGLKGEHAFIAGQSVPVTPDSLGPLNAAFKPYGVEFTYLPRTYGYTDDTGSTGEKPTLKKTIKSVISGGLLITSVQDIPTQGEVGGRYTIGRVALSATNKPVGGTSAADLVGGQDSAVGSGAGTDSSAGSAGSSGSASGDGAASLGAAEDGALLGNGTAATGGENIPGAATEAGAATTPTVDLVPAPGDGADTVAVGVDPASFGGQLTASGESFYLILVLAAVAAIGAAQLVRFFAVKA